MGKLPSIILYCVAIAIMIAWALIPLSWETKPPATTYDTISVLSPLVSGALFWSAVAAAGSLLILGDLSFGRRILWQPAIPLLIVFVGFPIAGFIHWGNNLGPWTLHGRVTSPNGETYLFCDSSFLQGQRMALARVEAESWAYTRLEVLGNTNGDSPRSWASLIRPANPDEIYGQLYLIDKNLLVGIRYGNHCYLAYDIDSNEFFGSRSIEEISPFVCIGEDDELHEADVIAIRSIIDREKPGRAGYPHRKSIEASFDHPNPRVKIVAESLLDQMDAQSTNTEP